MCCEHQEVNGSAGNGTGDGQLAHLPHWTLKAYTLLLSLTLIKDWAKDTQVGHTGEIDDNDD